MISCLASISPPTSSHLTFGIPVPEVLKTFKTSSMFFPLFNDFAIKISSSIVFPDVDRIRLELGFISKF